MFEVNQVIMNRFDESMHILGLEDIWWLRRMTLRRWNWCDWNVATLPVDREVVSVSDLFVFLKRLIVSVSMVDIKYAMMWIGYWNCNLTQLIMVNDVCCGMLKLESQILHSMMFWDFSLSQGEKSITYHRELISWSWQHYFSKTCKIHNWSFGCLIWVSFEVLER